MAAVSEEPTEGCEQVCACPLQRRRQSRQVDLLFELLPQDGEPQRAREAERDDLALAGEAKKLLECLLDPQCGSKRNDRSQLLVGVVPDAVRGSRGHDGALACRDDDRALPDSIRARPETISKRSSW
jgi:hypothetical protein